MPKARGTRLAKEAVVLVFQTTKEKKLMKNHVNTICLSICLAAVTIGTATLISGCAGDRYTRSTGEYIDDKGIDARITSALHSNGEYKFTDVQVVSFKGTVQLSGFVESRDQ